MPGTVKIPGVGNVKTTYVMIGGAAVAGIVAFAYYRQMNMPVVDETGEDMADFTEEIPADGSADQWSADYAADEYPTSGNGGYVVPYYPAPQNVENRDPVSDNEWVDVALQFLEERAGIDGGTAALALAKYRAGDCLSATQADVVRQAVGRYGRPPQSPSLSISTCTSPPPTTNPPTSTAVLPPPSSVKVAATGATAVKLDWTDVPGKKGYAMYRNGARVQSVVYSVGQFNNLRRNTSYKLEIATINADNREGSRRAVTVRTKK